MVKMIGLRTDPWGTPQVRVSGGDVCPGRESLWDLLDRYDWNHLRVVSADG